MGISICDGDAFHMFDIDTPPVDVSWQINGTVVQTNASVTEASYTNTSAVNGVWNVSAIVRPVVHISRIFMG
jgi:hypothetical protein